MKEILNFPNYYITKDGRVWSKKRPKVKGGWLKPSSNGSHLYFSLCNKGKIWHKYAHRLVLETYIGPCPDGMECRHLNGNPLDNRLENLCWGSCSDNHKDAVLHGTLLFGQGEKNISAKLTEKEVRFIFTAYHNKTHKPGELAKLFGINVDHVSRIARKERWGHLWNE